MNLTKRVFIALWPNDFARKQLRELSFRCKQQVVGRAVPNENLHITLAFLGELEHQKLGAVRDLVTSVKVKPFNLCLDRLGYWRRPQIIWVGCEKMPSQLINYQKHLRDGLISLGFDVDNRAYVAHLTLFRKVKSLPKAKMSPICWEVQGAHLVESKSVVGGVEYHNL